MKYLLTLSLFFISFFTATAQITDNCNIPTAELTTNNSTDIKVEIQENGSSASSYQPGENIEKSFDGNLNTLYHSNWSYTPFPVILNYHIGGDVEIDYMKYIPRQDGGNNGNFGNVTISYDTSATDFFHQLAEYDFGQAGTPTIIRFPETIKPLNIEIVVHDGYNDFASCAEMEFYKSGESSNPNAPDGIFEDDICSKLNSNIGQGQIDTIESDFYRALAQCLYNNSYNLEYRVQEYEVYKPVQDIHRELKVSGYSMYENPTGIYFTEGERIAVFAQNIGAGITVQLLVKDFENGYGGEISYYPLRNGLNVFDMENSGLGYVSYFNTDTSLPNVTLNIVSGKINGYFDKDKTDPDDWPALLEISTYPKMDIIGKYAHLVYDRDALKQGSPTDGLRLVEKYDEINAHERLLMGLYKYEKSPKNRILALGEYGGGYYAGGQGIHLDWTWGINSMAHPDKLDLWGIPHEYGHTNQIRPDLKWIGTTEVTNNVYAVWVNYLMNPDKPYYTRLEYENIVPWEGMPAVAGGRINGYINSTYVHGNPLQHNENYDVFKVLVPFWQLELYYQLAGACKDAPQLTFDYPGDYDGVDYARWYGTVAEVSRNTDSRGMSNGELMLNFVKNTCNAVQEDLTDFFLNSGFLRPIDVIIDDYGQGQLRVTEEMIEETITYIKSKNYDKPVSPAINYLSAHTVDIFRNKLTLQGENGKGVSQSGQSLIISREEWPHAVAFEAFDNEDKLMHVAIALTGAPGGNTTRVYYPADANEVYAVGYDGERRLVYPESTSSKNISDLKYEITLYPNPVSSSDKVHLETTVLNGSYQATLYTAEGKSLFDFNAPLSRIEAEINRLLPDLKAGTYFLNLKQSTGEMQTIKFVLVE